MKNIFTIACIISFALYSCKKEHSQQTQPVQKTFNVHFTVAGFSKSSVPFTTNSLRTNSVVTADSLKNAISVLYYLVYKNDFRYRKIAQYSTDPNFGSITDSFIAGTASSPNNYRVVVVAGKTNFTDVYTGTDPNASSDLFAYKSNGTAGWFDDTFYQSITFTMPDSAYNLTLNRVVSQLQVNIKDAVPANAKTISVIFQDYNGIYASTGTPVFSDSYSLTRTLTANATPGALNTALSAIVLNTGGAFNVEIKCTDASNAVLADKTVTGVVCKQNAVTQLTGNLFTAPGTDFNITYSPVWGSPIVRDF